MNYKNEFFLLKNIRIEYLIVKETFQKTYLSTGSTGLNDFMHTPKLIKEEFFIASNFSLKELINTTGNA